MSSDAEPVSKRKRLARPGTTLRFLGFCGADDSINPMHLGLICHAYPFVEFGVLFRPDRVGEPRYASDAWVEELSKVAKCSEISSSPMRLAAHLCGTRVNEVLSGDDAFVAKLEDLGFGRVQINATAVNGVDTSNLAGSVPNVASVVAKHTGLEFIIQKNDETRPLWEGLISNPDAGPVGKLPSSVTMLLDESKGTGVLSKVFPPPPDECDIGYAGGIGPDNIDEVLKAVNEAAGGRPVWIDMESSLRSTKNGKDVFDLDKCFKCIVATCASSIMHKHPPYLSTEQVPIEDEEEKP